LEHRIRRLSNVQAVNVAIGDQTRMSTIWIESAGDNGASLSLQNHGRHIQTRVIKADDLVAKLGVKNVDVLIVDAEGYEERILQGARRILVDARFLLVEVHHFIDPSMGRKIDDLLLSLGFEKLKVEIQSGKIEHYITVNLYSKNLHSKTMI
ncbi:MAG: FkbM family methyltransferase, partial [Nitrosopumilaceae archaeon]